MKNPQIYKLYFYTNYKYNESTQNLHRKTMNKRIFLTGHFLKMLYDLLCHLYYNVGIFIQVRVSEPRDYSYDIFIMVYVLNACQDLLGL